MHGIYGASDVVFKGGFALFTLNPRARSASVVADDENHRGLCRDNFISPYVDKDVVLDSSTKRYAFL